MKGRFESCKRESLKYSQMIYFLIVYWNWYCKVISLKIVETFNVVSLNLEVKWLFRLRGCSNTKVGILIHSRLRLNYFSLESRRIIITVMLLTIQEIVFDLLSRNQSITSRLLCNILTNPHFKEVAIVLINSFLIFEAR